MAPPQDIAILDQRNARFLIQEVITHIADWPVKSAAAFRNAIIGEMGTLAVNPMLDLHSEKDARFLRDLISRTVEEGRMIDFGFIPNEVLKDESWRSRDLFEIGELTQPFDDWLGVSSWEGGFNGYHISPHPFFPGQLLILELYGVSMPDVVDVIVVYDIISIEIKGLHNTMVYPATLVKGAPIDDESNKRRGSNSLDPLVTMLKLLSDGSVPIKHEPAPEKLNKARAAKGRFPIPAHTTVLTRDYVTQWHGGQPKHRHADKGGSHASPIAHWRRAHIRQLASGKVVAVRSSKVNWRTTEDLHRMFYKVKEGVKI